MSMPTPPELAARALAALDGDGWASVTRDQSASVVLPRGGQLRTTTVDRTDVTLTAWRDGHVGSVTTTATEPEPLRVAARRAVEIAERTARDADGPGDATPPPEPAAPRPHDGFDLATAAADPGAGLDAVRAAREHAEGRLPIAAHWHAGSVQHALAASTGLELVDRTTDAHLQVRAGAGGVRAGVARESARAVADLNGSTVAARAISRIPGGEWHDPTPGEQTIVLTAEAVAAILTVAASLVFDGFAAADGRTHVDGRLGTRVAASTINLSDTPRFGRTLPHAFDAAGTPKSPIPLIQDGLLHRLVHDGRSQASTGHATEPGGGPRGPRTTNLVLIGGGAADVQELVSGVDVGLLISTIDDLRPINAELGLAYGIATDGAARIVDGRVVGSAGSVPLLVSPLDVLGGVDALTAEQTLIGRPTLYGRRFGHGVVAPALRTRSGITVTN